MQSFISKTTKKNVLLHLIGMGFYAIIKNAHLFYLERKKTEIDLVYRKKGELISASELFT